MGRTDFVENRAEVIKNIYTLYSYAINGSEEEKDWALERFRHGKWYVVEPFGNTLLFAPSRFVGYKDNTRIKHIETQGNGTLTNENFTSRKLYKEATDEYLSEQFKLFMSSIGVEKESAKFFIPYEWKIADLKTKCQCYFVRPTHCRKYREEAWRDFLAQGIMAIGWNDPVLTNYNFDDLAWDYMDTTIPIHLAITTMKQIKEGDIICCTNYTRGLWGIGIAVSSCKFQQNIHYAGIDAEGKEVYYSNYIEVLWLHYKKQGYISVSTLHLPDSEELWPSNEVLSSKEIPQYIYDYLFNPHENTDNKYGEYLHLLKTNKNLILTGAPGTGKTYLAQEIAKSMEAEYEIIQFHPSYDYTDFIEGLRPVKKENTSEIGFERKDGIFKTFCKQALDNPKPFVFIIDEINRGEISKIFGELFFSIDPGYRGEKGQVKTQYQNLITDESDPFYEGFYVPENVYIIGTMNDIDRSVESMDFAMRRRFAWKEIKANEHIDMLDEFGELTDEIVEKMNHLNKAIWDDETNEGIEGLSAAYHIGGAYFQKLNLYLNEEQSNTDEAYRMLWENHLRGILFEYLRGSFNATEKLKYLEQTYYGDRVEE